MEHHVAGNGHGVLEIPLDLVENVFGRATEKDSACFRDFAFCEKGEVFIADLLNLEQPALCAYV